MFRKRRLQRVHEIAPEEIFLDSSNLPDHDTYRFEGRVERPVSRRAIFGVGIVFACIALTFGGRAFSLQVAHGATYADISINNTLRRSIIFASRGIIYDRTGKELAWNAPQPGESSATSSTYALRQYSPLPGLSLLIGFVSYPKQDRSGAWWQENYTGVSGVESTFNSILDGTNGDTMIETDAHGHIQRQDLVTPPEDGQNLTLSIDADVTSKLYELLSQHARDEGFQGGAAVIMNVQTGEILAITSFPEYDHSAFQNGDPASISAAAQDPRSPLLNRAIGGLYAPGSIVKPIFAAGALDSGIISPDKIIVSTGAISIPNPYDPSHPSLFHDWTVHGPIDMRTALAVSSDEYFYTIGGGYGGQQGLGISGLDKYAQMLGLGTTTGIQLSGEKGGVIPTPAWKARVFGVDQPWLLGDTYHTAIGQYGFQVTPIQAVRYISAIANGGKLLHPQLVASSTPEFTQLPISDANLEIVREGMHMAVTSKRSDATVKFFNIPGIELAAKTGTAQIGAHNEWMNSWSVGFWPASHPKYAYAVVLEHAPAGTASGAAPGMLPFFEWLIANHPEYTN